VSYGELVRDAFRITLRNRYLWFFGFFVGGLYGTNIGSNFSGGNFSTDDFGRTGASSFGAQFPFENTALIVGLVSLGILLSLAFVVLFLISAGGLVDSVYALDRGEERRFSTTFRAGTSRFWRVLGFYVLYFLISLVLLVVIVLPLGLLVAGTFTVTASTTARVVVSVLAALAAFLLIVILLVTLAIVVEFALREIIIRGSGVFGSFGKGFNILQSNLGKSLLVWLINIGLRIATWIAVGLALLIVGLGLFLPTIILTTQGLSTAALVAGIVAGVILLPLIILVSAALGTFFHAYWTLAYLRISSPGDQEAAQAEVAA
jgi:hypothetical protein